MVRLLGRAGGRRPTTADVPLERTACPPSRQGTADGPPRGLTPAGEAFVPAARAALRAAELAREAVDAVKGELRGRVTVGTMQGVWAGSHHAPAALRAEQFPDLATHRFERNAASWTVMVVRPRVSLPRPSRP